MYFVSLNLSILINNSQATRASNLHSEFTIYEKNTTNCNINLVFKEELKLDEVALFEIKMGL